MGQDIEGLDKSVYFFISYNLQENVNLRLQQALEKKMTRLAMVAHPPTPERLKAIKQLGADDVVQYSIYTLIFRIFFTQKLETNGQSRVNQNKTRYFAEIINKIAFNFGLIHQGLIRRYATKFYYFVQHLRHHRGITLCGLTGINAHDIASIRS